jgi:putative lipoic acid-binding regulatory protein
MHRREEEAVRWLKSVDNVPLTDEIPEVLQQLLSDFRALSSSTRRLDGSSKEHAKVLAAARATVEQQLQKVVTATEAHPREIQQEMMTQRKAVLGNWMAKTEEVVKDATEKLQHEHVEIRNVRGPDSRGYPFSLS